jgi:hypothetical protein
MHFRVEGNLVNSSASIILIHRLSQVGDIPDIEFLIFTSSNDQFSVGGDCNGINITFVRFELIPDSVIDIPNLEPAVPSDSCEEGLNSNALTLVNWTKSNLGYPVSVIILFSGHLAVSEGVEKSDFLLSSGC